MCVYFCTCSGAALRTGLRIRFRDKGAPCAPFLTSATRKIMRSELIEFDFRVLCFFFAHILQHTSQVYARSLRPNLRLIFQFQTFCWENLAERSANVAADFGERDFANSIWPKKKVHKVWCVIDLYGAASHACSLVHCREWAGALIIAPFHTITSRGCYLNFSQENGRAPHNATLARPNAQRVHSRLFFPFCVGPLGALC